MSYGPLLQKSKQFAIRIIRFYSFLQKEKGEIALSLTVDPEFGSVMEYFEIFLERMMMCRRAAECLGLRFSLSINGQVLL